MDKVNLREKLSLFTEHWGPRIAGELIENERTLRELQRV